MGGKSLSDILFSEKDGQVNPKRNRAYMGRERHDMGRYLDKGYPVRSIRTEMQKIKEDLWQELLAELQRTGDPRAFGNGDIFDSYRYVKDAPHAWYNLEKNYWARAEENYMNEVLL